ncbi:hypothetical protein D7X74_21215 [Corallococcus sp. CA047B]|uniref:hypothetical protein n=1 Tax=Corallococcus sp. CA047B TaxID=2316729 RepID=UPI000EA3C971|nr:hypothetical protein [Corallococcus sp. CA047B]RKH13770.1 hypothetical protein D7X74_21215 [Corallococcus sp. CA047B]
MLRTQDIAMPIVPPVDPQEETSPGSIRLSKRMWTELDTIATETGRTRNDVMARLLEWAVGEHKKGVSEPPATEKPTKKGGR